MLKIFKEILILQIFKINLILILIQLFQVKIIIKDNNTVINNDIK